MLPFVWLVSICVDRQFKPTFDIVHNPDGMQRSLVRPLVTRYMQMLNVLNSTRSSGNDASGLLPALWQYTQTDMYGRHSTLVQAISDFFVFTFPFCFLYGHINVWIKMKWEEKLSHLHFLKFVFGLKPKTHPQFKLIKSQWPVFHLNK